MVLGARVAVQPSVDDTHESANSHVEMHLKSKIHGLRLRTTHVACIFHLAEPLCFQREFALYMNELLRIIDR